MKAIVQYKYGSADVLSLQEMPTPTPSDDQVLLRVRVAGLDPSVWHMMAGKPYLIRLFGSGLRRPRDPFIGSDVAGVVESVGKNVTRFAPGDEVFGTAKGSFAQYAVAPEGKLVHKPANVTFEQAAAVPISGVTAWQALKGVQSGQSVLVIGAGGGVGTFAVQLAKVLGAVVTGVCSTAKVDLVRSLGADEVIDYSRSEITGKYDLVVDTAGHRSLGTLRRLLKPSGKAVLVGGEDGGPWIGAGVGRMIRSSVHKQVRPLLAIVKLPELQVLADLLETGKFAPVIDRTYSLEEVPEAIQAWETSGGTGKAIISIA